MRRWKKVSGWGAAFIIGLGLGIFLIQQGLSQAALWATVLGLPIAIIGALAGVWSFALAAKTLREARQPRSNNSKSLKEAHIELIDASVDPNINVKLSSHKPDVEDRQEQTLVISDIEQRYSAIDFKFLNRGDATAVLHRFTLEILEFELDLTPVLTYSYDQPPSVKERSPEDEAHSDGQLLKLTVNNDGWGDALRFRAHLIDPILSALFLQPNLTFACSKVPSGAHVAFSLHYDRADKSTLEELKARRAAVLRSTVAAMSSIDDAVLDSEDFEMLMSHHEKWHVREFFDDYPRDKLGPRQQWHREYVSELSSEYLPIRLDMEVEYVDQADNSQSERVAALTYADRSMAEGVLWIGENGFRYELHPVSFMMLPEREIYAVILDPERSCKRDYLISRAISPGEADRFHILLATTKSGTFALQLIFHVDRTEFVKSEPISVSLKRSRNARLPSELIDGATFEIHDGRLELGS